MQKAEFEQTTIPPGRPRPAVPHEILIRTADLKRPMDRLRRGADAVYRLIASRDEPDDAALWAIAALRDQIELAHGHAEGLWQAAHRPAGAA